MKTTETAESTEGSTIYQMQTLDSEDLKSLDDDYQRKKDSKRIAKIVSEWDERIANEPKVSFRDGNFYIFDGQHTVRARELINGGKNCKIMCKVYFGLTEEDEALLFAKQNGVATKPTAGIRMRAWLFGKDAEALGFRDATENAGFILELAGARSAYHILCINTALQEYRSAGRKAYVEALKIIKDAWNGSPDSLRYEIIKGMVKFVRLYKGMYNRERLITLLQCVNPVDICNRINSDFELPHSKKYVNQFFVIYNSFGRKGTLPMKF